MPIILIGINWKTSSPVAGTCLVCGRATFSPWGPWSPLGPVEPLRAPTRGARSRWRKRCWSH